MAKIVIHIPPSDFTLTALQEVFGISLETAFLIRRLCWYDFAPEEIPLKTPFLPLAPGQPLSLEEKILFVINVLVGGQGLRFLRDRYTGYRFPYIDRGDRHKQTFFYLSFTFKLSSLATVLGKHPLQETEHDP